jgi:hypothetical protein
MTRTLERPRRLYNIRTGTAPLVFHAHGYHDYKPAWPRIREFVFAQPQRRIGASDRVTPITCNNGHGAMGLFERSCTHLGIPVHVAGREFPQWINAEHKPRAILAALAQVRTPWVLYADSRDAVLSGDPDRLVDIMAERYPGAEMIFGGCTMSWPNAPELSAFEEGLPGAAETEYRHLNGGMWLARHETAQRFFEAVLTAPPHPAAPESEQGRLRALFPKFYPQVAIDHAVALFHNVGFLFTDPYEERPA